MAVVLFVWLFTFICLFGLGWLSHSLFRGVEPEAASFKHPFLICVGGLVLVTAIANCWAYFASVGALLNVLVWLLAILVLLRDRVTVTQYLRQWFGGLRTAGWPVKLGLVAILFITLLKSASPTEM